MCAGMTRLKVYRSFIGERRSTSASREENGGWTITGLGAWICCGVGSLPFTALLLFYFYCCSFVCLFFFFVLFMT